MADTLTRSPFVINIEQLDTLDAYANDIEQRCDLIGLLLEQNLENKGVIPRGELQIDLLNGVTEALRGIHRLSDTWARALRRAHGVPKLPRVRRKGRGR